MSLQERDHCDPTGRWSQSTWRLSGSRGEPARVRCRQLHPCPSVHLKQNSNKNKTSFLELAPSTGGRGRAQEGLVLPWEMPAQNPTSQGHGGEKVPSSPLPAILQGSGSLMEFPMQHVHLYRAACPGCSGGGPVSCCPPWTHVSGLQACLNFHHHNPASGERLHRCPRWLPSGSRKSKTTGLHPRGTLRRW